MIFHLLPDEFFLLPELFLLLFLKLLLLVPELLLILFELSLGSRVVQVIFQLFPKFFLIRQQSGIRESHLKFQHPAAGLFHGTFQILSRRSGLELFQESIHLFQGQWSIFGLNVIHRNDFRFWH